MAAILDEKCPQHGVSVAEVGVLSGFDRPIGKSEFRDKPLPPSRAEELKQVKVFGRTQCRLSWTQ